MKERVPEPQKGPFSFYNNVPEPQLSNIEI